MDRLIRQHRATLEESMKTVRPVRDRDQLVEIIRLSLVDWPVKPKQIKVVPYGYDSRIGWDTYLITIDGWGVWGMANGPIV